MRRARSSAPSASAATSRRTTRLARFTVSAAPVSFPTPATPDCADRLAPPPRVADRKAGARVLLDAVLRERIAQAVFRQCFHAGDRLAKVVGGQRHQHFVVEHPAIAALGKAGDRQARLAGLQRTAPRIGAGGFADDTPIEAL